MLYDEILSLRPLLCRAARHGFDGGVMIDSLVPHAYREDFWKLAALYHIGSILTERVNATGGMLIADDNEPKFIVRRYNETCAVSIADSAFEEYRRNRFVEPSSIFVENNPDLSALEQQDPFGSPRKRGPRGRVTN